MAESRMLDTLLMAVSFPFIWLHVYQKKQESKLYLLCSFILINMAACSISILGIFPDL